MPNSTRPFLECFYALADLDEAIRSSATKDLVAHLAKGEVDDEDMGAGSVDLSYAVKRLVRGLCSSRGAARQGFTLALSEVLRSFSEDESMSPMEVLDLVENVRKNQGAGGGKASGQEERDFMFAGLFGCIAVHRSGILVAKTTSEEDRLALTVKTIQILLSISKKKKWIRQSCYEVILSILNDMDLNAGKEGVLSQIVDQFTVQNINRSGEGKTVNSAEEKARAEKLSDLDAEQLQLGLGIREWLVKAAKNDSSLMKKVGAKYQLPKFIYSKKSAVRSGRIQAIVNALQETAKFSPQIHAVWDRVLRAIFAEEAAGRSVIREFWVQAVENPLMRSTHQRRALAFALFCRLLPKLSPLQASHLCSQTVLYSISVHTSSPDSHLHNSARMMIKTILTVAEKSMAMRSALVSSILTNEPFFDQKCERKGKKKKQRKKCEGVVLFF